MQTARVEDGARVVIMAGIGVMAGAASFTHMHDWTMANVPAGTGDWFGWANAMASELTPTVAVLDIRRRRRAGAGVGLPAVVLVASVALSLAAQFACASASVSGWLLAAVPAVAFLALTKMVLSGRHTPGSSAHSATDDSCENSTQCHEATESAPVDTAPAGPSPAAPPVEPAAADPVAPVEQAAPAAVVSPAPFMPPRVMPPSVVSPSRVNGSAVSR